MINTTFVYTSIVAALFMALSLKFLQLFSFIEWSPIGWYKKWGITPDIHFSIKWVLLIIGLMIGFGIIYILFSFLDNIPPSVPAIVVTVLVIVIAEWIISAPRSPVDAVKAISIPFLAVTAIVLRFISGTAIYMRKIHGNEEKSDDNNPGVLK